MPVRKIKAPKEITCAGVFAVVSLLMGEISTSSLISFDSKLADAGNPLVRQLGRHLFED
jgi:hypothetical protein